MKVGSTLLSSPTVGRGSCPSVMTECLLAGFAFIMAEDCPAAHHKYMTGVAWHEMLQCLLWRQRGALLFYGEIFVPFVCLSFLPFSRSALPEVKRSSLPENMRHVCIIQQRVEGI